MTSEMEMLQWEMWEEALENLRETAMFDRLTIPLFGGMGFQWILHLPRRGRIYWGRG